MNATPRASASPLPAVLPTDPSTRTVTLLMIAATLSVSMAPVLITLCGLPALWIAAGRLLGTSAIMSPFAWRKRAEFSNLTARDWRNLMWAGICFGLHFLLFTKAFDHTSFESATILLAAQPLIAAVLAWAIIGERTSRGMWISTIIAGGGLLLFIGEDVRKDIASGALWDGQHLFGDVLVLLGGVTIVLAFIIGRRLRQKLSAPTYTGSIFLIGGVVNLIGMLFIDSSLEGTAATDWAWLGALILIPTIFGHSVFQFLVKHVRVFFLNLVILVEPLVANTVKWGIDDPAIFGSFDMTPLKLIGGLTLLGGVAVGMIVRERTVPDAPPPAPTLEGEGQPS